ncbi:MAG: hypothetical protein RJA15_1319, partial [Actinomycetota bacterium]
RKERRAHQLIERLAEGNTFMRRAVHMERRAIDEQRLTEREPLDVIPVQMGDQRMRMQRVGTEGFAEVSQAGAQIEKDRIRAFGGDRNARGVPPVSGG